VLYWIATTLTLFSTSIPLALLILAVVGWKGHRALRQSEERNEPEDVDPDPHVIREVMLRENLSGVQNHMVGVTEVIPEWFRRNITLPLAMRVVGSIIQKGWFRTGFLADIGTIHFARWVVLPGTNKLVFFSNYDGSWESYLEDFITDASPGLTAIWSNCVGFPKTRNLFFEGAKDGDRFKRWARRSMLPTRLWYSAYPDMTAEQIRTNAIICSGIRKISTASDAEAWLELFGSIPRPDSALEVEEIQGLLFGGLRNLNECVCLAMRFGDENRAGAAAWLKSLLEERREDRGVTFGDAKPKHEALFVALSASGLAKLGLAEEASAQAAQCDGPANHGLSFPPAFVLGMHHETRRRVLGDYDDSDPKRWSWGAEHNSVDAILLVYGTSADDGLQRADNRAWRTILEQVEAEIARGQRFGVTRVHAVEMRASEVRNEAEELRRPLREPFGFVDGVSQPVIRGLSSLNSNTIHVVEPGEFVLGYKDNRGYFPPTPQVPAGKDKKDILPGPPARLPKRWPQFRRAAEARYSTRDFGRNGSFLVVRQLEQDVKGFNDWVGAMDPNSDYVAAKMMGRWKNGSSLVKYPHEAGKGDADNDFLFGRDDPQGHRCPLGAHIRRANPRDSLDPENEKEIATVNRHRLLRRGRPYREIAEGERREGILFMCLNADIERQFEFVQQNWINSASHHGLRLERDPIAAHCPGPCDFSMPDPFRPRTYSRPKPFVRVRGGGYFFLPSRSALTYLAEL
jgi:Dyp-type peroxidase family